jgi:hypothetical protein
MVATQQPSLREKVSEDATLNETYRTLDTAVGDITDPIASRVEAVAHLANILENQPITDIPTPSSEEMAKASNFGAWVWGNARDTLIDNLQSMLANRKFANSQAGKDAEAALRRLERVRTIQKQKESQQAEEPTIATPLPADKSTEPLTLAEPKNSEEKDKKGGREVITITVFSTNPPTRTPDFTPDITFPDYDVEPTPSIEEKILKRRRQEKKEKVIYAGKQKRAPRAPVPGEKHPKRSAIERIDPTVHDTVRQYVGEIGGVLPKDKKWNSAMILAAISKSSDLPTARSWARQGTLEWAVEKKLIKPGRKGYVSTYSREDMVLARYTGDNTSGLNPQMIKALKRIIRDAFKEFDDAQEEAEKQTNENS